MKVVDTRRISLQGQRSVLATLKKHRSKVQSVKFSTFSSQFLASSGDSIIFWNLGQDYQTYEPPKQIEELKQGELPNENILEDDNIVLNHIGHIGTVSDIDWNFGLDWTLMSASDDSETFVQIHKQNDCSMQIFRPLSLLYKEEEQAILDMMDTC